MRRGLYRCLIWMHPAVFRQRYAEEILWIFDETIGLGVLPLFVDGVISLFRQWFLRSNIWKMAAGTVVSTVLIFGWWHSQESRSEETRLNSSPQIISYPLFSLKKKTT